MAAANKKNDDNPQEKIKLPDPIALSQSLIKTYERAQPIIEEFIEKQAEHYGEFDLDPLNVQEAFTEYLESFWNDPERFWELQTDFWQKYMELWQESTRKFLGESAKSVIEPQEGDRRFKAKEWNESALFDFIKQSYLLTSEWMDKSIRSTQGLNEEQKERLAFASKLFTDAMSPTNFAHTNPEVIKETYNTGGENLIRGLQNLVEDMQRGQGELKISTTNYEAFKLGENIATTPGQVVYQNDLMQLIQYEPSTKEVYKRPLLVVPPWINKYYILDLKAENSYIKWAVSQGHTVFVISWVNPSKELSQKRFDNYMTEGVLSALDQIEAVTGEKQCNAVGYCLGGTLLSIALAWLAANKQEKRITSATFLTTLTDFQHAGDMKLFMSEGQIALMDKHMAESGILQAKQLQKTFSLLRANDLIWSFVVNNYLMGREPFPFDLLYWNDDSTNMPAAMHSFYLRKFYRDNLLSQPNGIKIEGTPIDLGKIKTPAYFLSTREDHIAPWKTTYKGTQFLSGPKTFTLAASGHIAGVVNHPDKNKYCFWTKEDTPEDPDAWMQDAQKVDGSWWPHWAKWLSGFGDGKIPARKIDAKKSIEAAPGSYVKVKS